MKIHLCSEVIRDLGFADQCEFARQTGYDGLEIAPFTLAGDPALLTKAQLAEMQKIADSEGVEIAGLHWLMAAPEGLSITAVDEQAWSNTVDFGRRLVEICRELGGGYLVHGSPAQRVLPLGNEQAGRERGIAYFDIAGEEAAAAGIDYIIEPLSRNDTGFVTSVDEARAIIGQLGHSSLKTMIDCYAAAANGENPGALIRREMPAGDIAHIHFNDINKRGPGEGDTDFRAVVDALAEGRYTGAAAVEPFDYVPDGPACAARAIGYLRGLMA